MTSSASGNPRRRRDSGRRLDIGGSDSLLNEMYADTPADDTAADAAREVPVSRSPRRARTTPTTPTPVPDVVDTPPPPAPEESVSRPRRLGNRIPKGMTKHTLYIPKATADALDAAAETLVQQLGGLVSKHRVLTALIAHGVAAADAVRQELRAEAIATMSPD